MVVITTASASREKAMVKPVAKLNAAPELCTRVNCRSVPITGRGFAESDCSAHAFVAKSMSQIVHAVANNRRTLAPLFLLLADHAQGCARKYLKTCLANCSSAIFAVAISLGINAFERSFCLKNHVTGIDDE